jgi:hypothetical protein
MPLKHDRAAANRSIQRVGSLMGALSARWVEAVGPSQIRSSNSPLGKTALRLLKEAFGFQSMGIKADTPLN